MYITSKINESTVDQQTLWSSEGSTEIAIKNYFCNPLYCTVLKSLVTNLFLSYCFSFF